MERPGCEFADCALEQLPGRSTDQAMGNIRAGCSVTTGPAINENSGQFSGAKLNSALNVWKKPSSPVFSARQSAQELRDLARAGLDATYQPPYLR